MQYRQDKYGNRLSVLGFGCLRLPFGLGRVDRDKTEALIRRAYEAGVNYFDTAYIYPGSEEALGDVLERLGIREKIYLATKLPQTFGLKRADFDRYFDLQKKRLRTSYIDYYLMHNVTSLSQWEALKQEGIEDWIIQKRSQEQIRQVGFSFHGRPDEFPLLLKDYPWDFVMIQYNYFNTDYQAGRRGLKLAGEMGIPVFIMEPLLGGKLANGLPKEATALFQKAKPGSTPAGWALNWIWNHPEVTVVLSGMNDLAQLEENIMLADSALPGMMSDNQLETINQVVRIFSRSYKIPCTGCGYCMPCPKKINIPACFAAYNTSFAMGRFSGMQQYFTSANGLGEDNYYASDCIECGKCESHCPQCIQIRSELKNVRRRLQPPGAKRLLKAAHRFIK